MKYTTPNDLVYALKNQLNYHEDDGLYIVSMDHCPSEQLTGDKWHTTSIILSMGTEHADLANKIALRLHPKRPSLSKWVNASKKYRKRFLIEFLNELYHYPPVYVFSISANDHTINNEFEHFIKQLELGEKYKIEINNRISFGPFYKANSKEEIVVTMSENRAKMCLFIVHFVLRIHRKMCEAANYNCPETPCLN